MGVGDQVPRFTVNVDPTRVVPVIVGVGAVVNVAFATAAVYAEYLATDAYPVFDPITRTRSVDPAYLPFTVYVLDVAPEIGEDTPSEFRAYHW